MGGSRAPPGLRGKEEDIAFGEAEVFLGSKVKRGTFNLGKLSSSWVER